MTNSIQPTVYQRLGPEKLHILVTTFYNHVAKHPELAPIFPSDLTETAERQYKFLTQFFGGPDLYSREHGHPMLRARHLPFEITPTRARAWIECMQEAMGDVGIENELQEEMLARLQFTAQHMVNTLDN